MTPTDSSDFQPWQDTGPYKRYYYFGKDRTLRTAVVCLAGAAIGFYLTLKFVADPNWHPTWPKRVRGKGAAFVFLFFAIMSLPFWIRTPIAFATLAETIVYWVAMMVWSFDSRPDFAIGPSGIYGVDYLNYRHLSWNKLSHVEDQTIITKHRQYRIVTFVAREGAVRSKTRMILFANRPAKIKIMDRIDVHPEEILGLVRQFAPQLYIEVKTKRS
jgi:hypothetical protein